MKTRTPAFLLLLLVGCAKDHTPEQHVNVISSIPSAVPVTSIPPSPAYEATSWTLVTYLGNIDPGKRLSHVDAQLGHTLTAYIKTSATGDWQQIHSEGILGPLFTYDPLVHEIRFQNCQAGWAYVVYVLNPIQPDMVGY